MADDALEPGLYEALLTGALKDRLAELVDATAGSDLTELANAEATDRLSRHVAGVIARAIEAAPERERARVGIGIARELIELLSVQSGAVVVADDLPLDPGQVLAASCAEGQMAHPRSSKPH